MQTEFTDRPIVENADKDRIILFGGEIYDFAENVNRLVDRGHQFENRKNAAEFLLHAYEDENHHFLRGINGRFACAIADQRTDTLILANDCFGIQPLFIYESDAVVIFSSEYEPITACEGFDNRLNDEAIIEYYTLGLPLGEKTFFPRIRNLAPATILKYGPNGVSAFRYEELDICLDRSQTIHQCAQKVAEVVQKSVQARLEQPFDIQFAL